MSAWHRLGWMAFATAISAGCSTSDEPPPPRTLVQRPLLAAPIDDLLLDPFVTADSTTGHFVLVQPLSGTSGDCNSLFREVLSASPSSVAAGGIVLGPNVNAIAAGCTALVASFAGTSVPVSAQIWVSLDDESGDPTALPANLEGVVTASLVANTVPASAETATPSYPLVFDGTPQFFGNRTWAHLVSGAATVPQGGLLVITLVDPNQTLHLSGPGVAPLPSTGAGEAGVTPQATTSRAVTPNELAAARAYTRAVQRRRKPPRLPLLHRPR